MEFVSVLFGLVVTALLVALPVLAISAYIRVRRLERQGTPTSNLDASTPGRLQELEQRVRQVEQKLAALAAAPAPTVPRVKPAEPPPTPELPRPAALPTPSSPVTPPAPQPRAEATWVDLETAFGGRWLNRIGIIALLLAVAFFLKYAFDNEWVGPWGRVTIGLLAGTALLAYSQWLLRRGYRYFSEGIAGLGAGVLYLSLYAGWNFYRLFPQTVAFAGMILVTSALVGLALRRSSLRIALLALLGGFLTPLLLGTGQDRQSVLFSYLAVLDVGLLVLARSFEWRSLELISFACTWGYFWMWYGDFYDPSKLLRTAAFATVFFLLFSVLPVLRTRRSGQMVHDQIVLVLSNAFGFLLVLHFLLWSEHREILTVAVLVLAAAYLGAARVVQPLQPSATPLAGLLYSGLALTFLTLAIPIQLEGKWITIAWAVEGTTLVWTGVGTNSGFLRRAGLVLFGLVALRLLLYPIPAERFLWNQRFATFAVAVACFGLAVKFVKPRESLLDLRERSLFAAVGVALNVFAVLVLSREVWDLFGRMRPDVGLAPDLTQQLALSLLWTLYASGLIALGVWRDQAALRWQALALFGLVVAKVFLFDLSFLKRIYRILSFLVVGVVLLVVSFLYQRRLAGSRPEAKL